MVGLLFCLTLFGIIDLILRAMLYCFGAGQTCTSCTCLQCVALVHACASFPNFEKSPLENSSYTILYIMLCTSTSSTAQGGGGRFKNRKPIGEAGCCE